MITWQSTYVPLSKNDHMMVCCNHPLKNASSLKDVKSSFIFYDHPPVHLSEHPYSQRHQAVDKREYNLPRMEEFIARWVLCFCCRMYRSLSHHRKCNSLHPNYDQVGLIYRYTHQLILVCGHQDCMGQLQIWTAGNSDQSPLPKKFKLESMGELKTGT